MLMLGSKKSGKTYLASKFGKTTDDISSSIKYFEKDVYIGNKHVKVLITDPTAMEEEQLSTNSLFNNLAATIFVFNPYEDPNHERLTEWNNLLSHNIRNPHISVTVVANCHNSQNRNP